MTRRSGRWALAAVAALWGLAAAAQNASPGQAAQLLRHTFEQDEQGWIALGPGAQARTTHEAADVRSGSAALQFDYAVAKGQINVLILPLPEGAPAGTRSFRLWAKADAATTLAVALQERGGARYIALVAAPANRWQEVRLATSDFVLSDLGEDPQDPNNQLDLSEIEAVAMADFGQFLAQNEDPDIARLVPVKPGPHRLLVDDFAISSAPLPPTYRVVGGALVPDTFARPQLDWMAVGATSLSLTAGGPLNGPGLRAGYRQEAGHLIGLVHALPRGALTGAARLTFTAASAKPVKLLVQLEERGGGKYNTAVDLPGDGAMHAYSVNIADMVPADDSKDANGRLDPSRVKQLTLIDVGGLLGMSQGENTLWIGAARPAAGG